MLMTSTLLLMTNIGDKHAKYFFFKNLPQAFSWSNPALALPYQIVLLILEDNKLIFERFLYTFQG